MRRILTTLALVFAVAGFTAAAPAAVHADGPPAQCSACHG